MAKTADIADKKQYKRLRLFLILLLGAAGAFILYSWWPLITGKAVVLATRPVDPFDILQGQYMAINYEISNIPAIAEATAGDAAYVTLKEDESGIWQYESASTSKPKEGTFIKGTIRSVHDNSMQVEYGIDKYFFERDAQFPTTNITVEVKISSTGDARISNLLHNGKPIEIRYKEISITS